MKDFGTINLTDGNLATFEIIDKASTAEISQDKENFMKTTPYVNYGRQFKFHDHTVAAHGNDNLLPNEAVNYIRYNPYLPEILKKQVRILLGQGLYCYKEDFDDEGRKKRIPVKRNENRAFWDWLDSWKANGLPDDPVRYIKKVAFNYYYMEGYYDKIHKNRSRLIGGNMPIRGLEVLNGKRCRLATTKTLKSNELIEDEDCNRVIFGTWDSIHSYNSEWFWRFDEADPFKHAVDVHYVADKGFDEDIYALPTYFYGLRNWIKGANLNPKYINSYLKNSFNAKIHAIIPQKWIESKKKALEDVINENQNREQAGKDLITDYDGLTGLGTEYSEALLHKLIELKTREAVNLMSGAGENQGKIFWTRSFQTEQGEAKWEFVDIPQKYKEFIDTLISHDKRAMQVILAGKGLDPSISNVSNEGIFSNSGSQVYYNYLIYLDTLQYAEDFVTYDLEMAARLNFPKMKREGIKVGLIRNKPERTSEISENNRMENQNA